MQEIFSCMHCGDRCIPAPMPHQPLARLNLRTPVLVDATPNGGETDPKLPVPGPTPTLKLEVVRRLEEEIVSGVLVPGTRLDEVQLSERYGLSRTPLREALAQLAASGMVEIRPRAGAFVTQLTPRAMLECLAFTAEVEAIAAQWAAVRMTTAERASLKALQRVAGAAVAAGDADRYFDHNRQFHAAIYAGAHNSYVQEQASQLFMRGAPYRRLQLRQRGRLATSHAEHQAIADAIFAEDGAAAATAIRAHIIIQGDRFMEFLATLPEAYIGRETR
jgi:DNA-binding GntR family transcriptional regulator